jgi:hypothetical protein
MSKRNYVLVPSSENEYWLGGSDLAEESKWIWASKLDSMSYTNWGNGQPDNHEDNEHCLEFRGGNNYRWNDKTCSFKMFTFCQVIE